nr:hypothetical protein [uncultured Lichenicoccus sp.]
MSTQKPFSPEDDAKLIKLHEEGLLWPSITARLHRSQGNVRRRGLQLMPGAAPPPRNPAPPQGEAGRSG